jgi:hypothetical protein
MRNTVAALIHGLGLMLLTAGGAMAQDSFANLQTKLRLGDVVTITDDAGRQTRGTFQGAGTSIRLSVDGGEREWTPQQVREIRRRGDSISNGLKIGLIAGTAAGVVIGLGAASIYEAEGHDGADILIPMVALGIGAGAGIGAGLDAAITGSTTVYRRSGQKVSIAPMLSPHAQGVRVGLAF